MTNITSYKGLPISLFVALESDTCISYDPTLYTYEGEIRSHANNSLVDTLTVVSATDSCGDEGVQITLSAADSDAISTGIYKYKVRQIETATGIESMIFYGDFMQCESGQ